MCDRKFTLFIKELKMLHMAPQTCETFPIIVPLPSPPATPQPPPRRHPPQKVVHRQASDVIPEYAAQARRRCATNVLLRPPQADSAPLSFPSPHPRVASSRLCWR